MYDLIGDIHGYCTKLEALLTKLQYQKADNIWQHPTRKVIYVGDYIDRGPGIRETLRIVRDMTEAGHAIAIMGNHECNALAYDTADGNGGFLRPHNVTNTNQHRATLEQFVGHEKEWQSYLQWFYTLPLFLDLGNIRVVHACWDEYNIKWLKSNGHVTMSPELLVAAHVKGSKAYEVIEQTLKGKEFNIPAAFTWHDKDGHARNSNRVRWWEDPASGGYQEFLFNCPPALAAEKIPADIGINIYPADAPPVFFGHYWLENAFPVIQKENVICLDFSVAKGGALVGYRWEGEKVLRVDGFVWV